jgi:Ca2+-binding EF-hand superfamily protein
MIFARKGSIRAAAISAVAALVFFACAGSIAAQGIMDVLPESPQRVVPAFPPAPPLQSPEQYLVNLLFAESTLPQFLQALGRDFQGADTDMDGQITQADADIRAEFMRAELRAMYIMVIMRADLDGDGVITEDELRRSLRYETRAMGRRELPSAGPAPASLDPKAEAIIETQMRELMAVGHDGRVTIAEVAAYAATLAAANPGPEFRDPTVPQLLKLVPDGKTALTWDDLVAMGTAFFHKVDTDGNGTVSFQERKAYLVKVEAAKASQHTGVP